MRPAGPKGAEPERSSALGARRLRAELLAVVFVTGAAVMALEILGTRIVGPVFGVNLFVWSALLSVTLTALAAGYYAGGVVVDRRPSLRLPGLVMLGAGVALAIVPALRAPVLRAAEDLGPRGGPLVAALVLFAPSLAILGTAGPIVVRLMTDKARNAGHRVGATYAVSTAGGLLGTLVTGFVLVPAFETTSILLGISAALCVAGGVLVAVRGRVAAVLAVLAPLLGRAATSSPALPDGIVVRDRAQSLYGLVEVIDDENRHVRLLRADHSIIGAQYLADRAPAFSFIHLLEAVRFARPDAKRLLQVGLGTGALGAALGPRGMVIDAVEIDPVVVRFAGEYFGFRTTGDVFAEDARTFLLRTDRRYDVVVHDTFTGGTTPEHLLSLEVIRRLRDVLAPGGIVVLNFVGYASGPHAGAAEAVARTLHAVFPTVRGFHDGPTGDAPDAGNIIFFASDAPLEFPIPADATFENPSCERVARSFGAWEVLQRVPDGPVITDAKNPLATLELPVAVEHFEAMNKLLPVDVWLH